MMNRDSEKQQLFTMSAFAENYVGVLNQVTSIYTRRCINIESISASACSIPGVSKFTITSWSDRATMEKVVRQIEKRIDVIKAFLYTDDDIVYQEVALYKVPTSMLLEEKKLEWIIRKHSARILEITPEYTVIEKTGHRDETESLFEALKRYDIRQFVRSGRVTITKDPVEYVTAFLAEREKTANDERGRE
ncbi:MAG: acetolactate synthase small subunit [Clostridiales bacterium]|nr:acetolactate synthase small subunit [Clostridiales bacterium]